MLKGNGLIRFDSSRNKQGLSFKSSSALFIGRTLQCVCISCLLVNTVQTVDTSAVCRYLHFFLSVAFTSLNFFGPQVVQGPRALLQRQVTRARQEGWHERQVGLPPSRRQGHGGPLKTKLHPLQTQHPSVSFTCLSFLTT